MVVLSNITPSMYSTYSVEYYDQYKQAGGTCLLTDSRASWLVICQANLIEMVASGFIDLHFTSRKALHVLKRSVRCLTRGRSSYDNSRF